jgi:hypothetical protein
MASLASLPLIVGSIALIQNNFDNSCGLIEKCPNLNKWFQINLQDSIIPVQIIVLIILMINGLPSELAILLYMNKFSGCYMINGSTITKLEDCSNFYNQSFENQLLCTCGVKIKEQTTLDCDKDCQGSNANLPYCIGNCNNDKNKCKTTNNMQIGKCTDTSIDSENFVYYTYRDYSPISLISNSIIVRTKIFEYYKDNINTNKNNTFRNIILIVILLILFIMLIFLLIKILR